MRKFALPTAKLIEVQDLRGASPESLRARLLEKFPALSGIFKDDLEDGFQARSFIDYDDVKHRLFSIMIKPIEDFIRAEIAVYDPHSFNISYGDRYVDKPASSLGMREFLMFKISYALYAIEQRLLLKGELSLPRRATEGCSEPDLTIPNRGAMGFPPPQSDTVPDSIVINVQETPIGVELSIDDFNMLAGLAST
jgi:hypothetical protein